MGDLDGGFAFVFWGFVVVIVIAFILGLGSSC